MRARWSYVGLGSLAILEFGATSLNLYGYSIVDRAERGAVTQAEVD